MASSIVAPSQDNIEEHQTFLASIYQVIEAKLVEEDGIFIASDAEISDQKWSPLALDADIPPADIIDQEWVQTHTHSEFLREQACLNNYAVVNWRILWTVNPPDKNSVPEYYHTWSKLNDYCCQATQTWYNICFKELKEDMAEALDLDPITLRDIKTTTDWLADELEAVGKDPKFAAQQVLQRAESVASSKHQSRAQSPEQRISKPTSPKPRSRSVDVVLRLNPTTPENKEFIDIHTPTLHKIKERLESVALEIMSLEYINEPKVKSEEPSVIDVEMADTNATEDPTIKDSMVIVNPAPIRHKPYTDLVTEPSGNMKDVQMDTSEDFTDKSFQTYHTAPTTLSPLLHAHTERIQKNVAEKDKGKGKETYKK
ncbi:hypothetical protein AX15_007527 [Amanita polypyramis BW_CC]|nr:hypothetical protein AX15_007527 [Amanita polypyramis BW_CC]